MPPKINKDPSYLLEERPLPDWIKKLNAKKKTSSVAGGVNVEEKLRVDHRNVRKSWKSNEAHVEEHAKRQKASDNSKRETPREFPYGIRCVIELRAFHKITSCIFLCRTHVPPPTRIAGRRTSRQTTQSPNLPW